jgi:cytochrome b pre-mRNA-processing protein 3
MLAQTYAWLTRRRALTRKARDIYGAVVAAARQPGFYGPGRVADTPEGRFELVALHVFLVAERVKALKDDGNALTQALIEAFVTDMDDCMREMGVGDLTVPKRVKRAAALFYERSGAYRDALAKPGMDDPLAPLLANAILQTPVDRVFADELAAYMLASSRSLGEQTADDFSSGRLRFAPAPLAAKSTA